MMGRVNRHQVEDLWNGSFGLPDDEIALSTYSVAPSRIDESIREHRQDLQQAGQDGNVPGRVWADLIKGLFQQVREGRPARDDAQLVTV